MRSIGFFLAFLTAGFVHAGTITTVAGGGSQLNGSVTTGPMAVDGAGALYLPHSDGIVKLAPNGETSLLSSGPGPLTCIAVDSASNVYFAAVSGGLKRMTAAGDVTVLDSSVNFCRGLAVDAGGNLYMSLGLSATVARRDAATGTRVTVAGTGSSGEETFGVPATSSRLFAPGAIVLDNAGGFYLAAGKRVLRVDSTGMLSHVTGGADGAPAASPGSLGRNSSFSFFGGFAVDGAGNVYIPSASANRVFRVDSSDVVHVFAGTGVMGTAGDGGLPPRVSSPARAPSSGTPWAIPPSSIP